MEPNQIVPDQLPDENDIDRLFPKCPPTTPGKKSFSNSRKSQRKVQQHSRKELEARRNKLKAFQLQQQQQQQAQHLQQLQQRQLNKRHLLKQSSKGKSTDSSDDDTRLNNNVGNGSGKKNSHSSKRYTNTNTQPRGFPQLSSSPTAATNNSQQHFHNIIQPQHPAQTYGHQPTTHLHQTSPLEPVSTQPPPNLSDNINNNNNIILANYENQANQYSIEPANDINVATDTNNDNNNNNEDIKEIIDSNILRSKQSLDIAKQILTDDEIGVETERGEQQQQPATKLEQKQQQQENQLKLSLSDEIRQYSAVSTVESVVFPDGNNDDTTNLTPNNLLTNETQLDNIVSNVNECRQDKFFEPQVLSSSRRKSAPVLNEECAIFKQSNNQAETADNDNNDIIGFSSPKSPSKNQPVDTSLEGDEEGAEQMITQQMSNSIDQELLNDDVEQCMSRANETVVITNNSDIELSQPTIQLETFSENDEVNIGLDRSFSTRAPNLRHHKLPNESSHYSIVRVNSGPTNENDSTAINSNATLSKPSSTHTPLSTLPEEVYGPERSLKLQPEVAALRQHKPIVENSGIVRSNINIVATDNNEIDFTPPRSSSLQFNTLSDAEESGRDETLPSGFSLNQSTRRTTHTTGIPAKKCDPSSPASQTSNRLTRSSSKQLQLDDDLAPTTRTALIFPRLDEGLSSEAESCDDEVEDDDERAVDADVDADDDEEEDDADDDVDEDTMTIDRDIAALHLGQPSVDCFVRQQQQSKSQYRLDGLSHQLTPNNRIPDQSDIHQLKGPESAAYGVGCIGQDLFNNDSDLKTSTPAYPNHNSQANHWMASLPNQQQTNLQPHPSSSQQHCSQRNNNNVINNNINLMKNSHSAKRDEVKAANRLSSDTDNETDRLLGTQRNEQLKLANNDVNGTSSIDPPPVNNALKQNANSKEVLIEGVLFNVKYLGSTHSDCEGRSEKEDRIHQAEMAVHEVKFRNGLSQESQSSTEVQLFISTEKIMVLDDKHRKIMMDHSLRTISYIADIGDAIVLIVRKKSNPNDAISELGRPISKISCHVFESSESHTITKSISQAFQVAYTELLKANGSNDTSSYLPKELDYQEVLNSQEMSTDELEMFARKENQREVIVPKKEGEIIGFGIVESGWGSVLPTVVIASLKHDGPAYRCKKLFIGDQILSINGISLVGLPLSDCQQILSKIKNQRVARLSVVPCPLIVEVKIKRPDVKYQLGFSVQNGVICSLLRGGIAERGGVRVGHRIISINGTTVVDVPHEKIVTLLASSVGEIRMKTCLTSLYRLILGEENPVYY